MLAAAIPVTTSLVASARSCAGWSTTWIARDSHATADDSRNALGDVDRHTARNTLRLCDHLRFHNLFAGRVRNSLGTGLLNHATGCVRNSLCDAVSFHATLGVRNSLCHALVRPRTRCVRNFLGAGLSVHRAGCVRNSLDTGLLNHGAGGVRNLFGACYGNTVTHGVRNFASANFRNHSSAANRLFDSAWYPTLAADRAARTRAANNLRTAWVARIRNAFLNHWAWHRLGVGFPTATLNWNRPSFCHRLHHSVATVSVAGLCFRLVRCVALFTVAGLVNRLANRVTLFAIAGLVDRLANVVAHVAVAGLVNRLANVASDRAVAGFHNRLANVDRLCAVTGFVNRLANRVGLIPVAGLINVSNTGNRNRLCAAVHNDSHSLALLLFPHNFADRLVLDAASTFCTCEISAGIARAGWTRCVSTEA